MPSGNFKIESSRTVCVVVVGSWKLTEIKLTEK